MIALFGRVSDALQRRGWMIEFSRNLNPEFWMPRDGVIINRNAAIGRDELAIFSQDQRIDLKRTSFNAARSRK